MKRLRFAVLHHTGWAGRPNHCDLLLQYRPARGPDDRALLAFGSLADEWLVVARAGAKAPPAESLWAALPDHRAAYLRWQGPVSGGRGAVRRVESGTLEWLPARPGARQAWRFRLHGRRWRGAFALARRRDGRYVLRRQATA